MAIQHIAETRLDKYHVSTVNKDLIPLVRFMDELFKPELSPFNFETEVFNIVHEAVDFSHCIEHVDYKTREEALAGHDALVKKWTVA